MLVIHPLSGTAQTLDVSHTAGHRFDTLQEQNQPDITLADGKLRLAPYSSAIVR